MLLTLTICTVVTSLISGVIGMGGGVLLLSLMTFFLPLQVIVPVHGVVQLVSNISRSWYLKKDVLWSFVTPFLFGAPIGLAISYQLIKVITNEAYLYLILGCFIQYIIFKPKHLPEFRLQTKGWFALGIASGIQGPLIGVTGPLLAPFFIRSDIKKENIVATKAAQQIITHLFKIPLFISLSFDFSKYINMMSSMSIAALVGTFFGIKLLGKINKSHFQLLFKVVLFFTSLRLFYKFYLGVIL